MITRIVIVITIIIIIIISIIITIVIIGLGLEVPVEEALRRHEGRGHARPAARRGVPQGASA